MPRHPAAEVAALAFRGSWRRYQQLALDAFEQNLRGGSRHTYIVAPPGAGKTLLGMEMLRRLGARALVLVPNSALQGQWLRAAQEFAAPAGLAAASEAAPIAEAEAEAAGWTGALPSGASTSWPGSLPR